MALPFSRLLAMQHIWGGILYSFSRSHVKMTIPMNHGGNSQALNWLTVDKC